jgi:hypothetical protein
VRGSGCRCLVCWSKSFQSRSSMLSSTQLSARNSLHHLARIDYAGESAVCPSAFRAYVKRTINKCCRTAVPDIGAGEHCIVRNARCQITVSSVLSKDSSGGIMKFSAMQTDGNNASSTLNLCFFTHVAAHQADDPAADAYAQQWPKA